MYQAAKKSLCDRATGGGIDFDTDDIWCLLASADQSGNLNTHDFRDDVTQEVSGTNYSAGGVDAGTITVTASSGTVTIDGPDVTFSNITVAAIRGSVLYKKTGGAASTDLVIFWHDHGAQSVTGADYVIQVNASGWATLS